MKRTAVIFNPEKISEQKLQKLFSKLTDQELFLIPTESKTNGAEASKRAIDLGVERIIAAGGDGTLRYVVEGSQGADVVIGILPIGTGNVLARNLRLPINNLEAAAARALSDVEHSIDLGVAEVVDASGNSHTLIFTGIAGLGMDAKVMAATDKKLKRKIGWIAYIEASVKSLPLKFEKFDVSIDGSSPRNLKSYSLLIGNAGWLPGQISMMPDARLDDGRLDMAAIGPRKIWNWVDFLGRITWQNHVVRPLALGRKWLDATANLKTLENLKGSVIEITPATPTLIQLDGDPMFKVVKAKFSLMPKALRISI